MYGGIPVAREIEVGVIRQIENGGLAGGSAVLDRQLVLLRECIDDLYVELPGVALLAVGSDVAEGDLIRRSLLGVPDALKPLSPPCSALGPLLIGS